MQSQDPSQGAYPRFEEPNPTANFPVKHGNTYDQTNQGYIPPPQYGQPEQTHIPSENSLLVQSGVQEIDQKLESGCWACYNCWAYMIVIGSVLTTISAGRQVIAHPILLLNILHSLLESAFAFYMQDALKKKRLEDANEGWILSRVCPGFFALIAFFQRSAYIRLFGVTGAYGFFAGYALYYALVFILPAFQLKALLERREMLLKSANPYQVQAENTA